jgi:hypothetical protein
LGYIKQNGHEFQRIPFHQADVVASLAAVFAGIAIADQKQVKQRRLGCHL